MNLAENKDTEQTNRFVEFMRKGPSNLVLGAINTTARAAVPSGAFTVMVASKCLMSSTAAAASAAAVASAVASVGERKRPFHRVERSLKL